TTETSKTSSALPSAASPSAKQAAAPPWQAVIDQQAAPPPFAQIAFQSDEPTDEVAGQNDLAAWFAPTPRAGLRLGTANTHNGKVGTIEGLGRLQCPWLSNSVLRLTPENFNRLRMHFFHKGEGVTLIYFEVQAYRWA